ncbi:hypothetical protein BB560_002296 [Smittium megazygosporum]|uniref:Coatomer subunit beta n=1 Tax=Smittium megazygosporum TaxID=133381 RepID=A0A2T9ZFA4_9FUNG|nr:hypothetical protein BB560_002296 [Smittium megazygosporum]
MTQELCYSLIEQKPDLDIPNLQVLKRDLERGTPQIKKEALEKIIIGTLNGEQYDSLLMHIISNALLNDLHHPNEYIRGATLRFLCRIKDIELLEPLIGPVRECLEHRHAYVRRNSVLAISTIYKRFPQLLPDAPELILSFLVVEPDSSCKRNALLMLTHSSIDSAVSWLMDSISIVGTFDACIQLAVIEIICKAVKTYPNYKQKFIACLFELLSSQDSSVKFEAATILVSFTNNSVAIKAAATSLIQLVINEADNNVKLIVLERLDYLRSKHEGLLGDLVVDFLRILPNSNIEVKRRCLKIVMNLTSQRNIADVVDILKKELKKTLENDSDKASDYRELLVQTIHSSAVSFPEVAADVSKLFLSAISEFSKTSAAEAISFVREVVEKFPLLRKSVADELLFTFLEIKTSDAMCKALWLLGEYSDDMQMISSSWEKIKESLGELPLLAKEEKQAAEALDSNNNPNDPEISYHTTTKILPDGTYATESSLTSQQSQSFTLEDCPPLRALLLGGDYFVGTVLANSLVKLVLSLHKLNPVSEELNKLSAEALLVMIGIIRIGQSTFVSSPIDDDSYDRILSCIRAIEYKDEDSLDLENAFLTESYSAFARIVEQHDARQKKNLKQENQVSDNLFDTPLEFRLLQSKSKEQDDNTSDFDNEISNAETSYVTPKLDSLVQLTGFSDPIYVEAYMAIHQYDIMLDILVVNQTNETLKNITIDFSTLSDLKLVEKPRPYSVSPKSFSSVKAVLKVSSAEAGVIFGNLTYDASGTGETRCIEFSDITVDILEYIHPEFCEDSKFYSMWSEFEWENKINVNTKITDLRVYLDKLIKATNMMCLTPESALSGDCGFLAANLYSRSIFGEDALMNLSIEKVDDDSYVTGHIRIRSKSQGIALSLGDKISQMQNKPIAA